MYVLCYHDLSNNMTTNYTVCDIQENLCISGTHTHSGPGGFSQYVLYQTSTYGFVNETFTAWVDGITTSLISGMYRNNTQYHIL